MIKLVDVNPHITCRLCSGYLIDATTITDCLHTFCKSCIVTHLRQRTTCPQCGTRAHDSHPLMGIKADRTMQDIVYKIVPNILQDEEQRREVFYKRQDIVINREIRDQHDSLFPSGQHNHLYKNDEKMCFCLERYSPQSYVYNGACVSLGHLNDKFVRCSVRVHAAQIKQILHQKLSVPHDVQLEILCGSHLIHDTISLKQIWLTYWCSNACTMVLFYRIPTGPA